MSSVVELVWPGKERALTECRDSFFPELVKTELLRNAHSAKPVQNVLLTAESFHQASMPPVFLNGAHSLIGCDNLFALRALWAANKDFHFIYIDPPYNSGQSLSFKDDFSLNNKEPKELGNKDAASKGFGDKNAEAAWLNFMYPRIYWGHRVLRENGVMFVSIDDRQVASLSLIMNEIFGKKNHIATLKWRKKRKPSFLDSHLSSTMEYILVYAKQKDCLPRFIGEKTEEPTRPVLNGANAVTTRILRRGTEARCAEGLYKKGHYVNRTLGIELLDDAHVYKGCLATEVRVQGRFRVSQEVLDTSVFITQQFGLRRHVLEAEKTFKHVSDDCTSWPTNEDAESELRKIFGVRVFDYAKPVGLIQNLLAMCVIQEEEFRCLDFFAGSGTLAEAVLAQNAQDSKNRTFCCVQSFELLNLKRQNTKHERNNHSKNIIADVGGVADEFAHLQTIFDVTMARTLHAWQKFGEKNQVEVFVCR